MGVYTCGELVVFDQTQLSDARYLASINEKRNCQRESLVLGGKKEGGKYILKKTNQSTKIQDAVARNQILISSSRM